MSRNPPERRSSDTRIALLEQSFGAMATDISEVKQSQHDTKATLDEISLMIARQQGAAKVVKWAGNAFVALLAGLGGALSGNVAAKASAVVDHVK